MIYVDTNILIYFLEGHKDYGKTIAGLLEEFATQGHSLATSAITVTEFLAGTISSNLRTLQQIPRLEIIILDEVMAEQAANLQREYATLQIGDAIHLATAIRQQATLFFTNDKPLARIASTYFNIQSLSKD